MDVIVLFRTYVSSNDTSNNPSLSLSLISLAAFERVINPKDLQFWYDKELNVLLEGEHGVGKTTQVLECWEKNKSNFRYFSAATMDPWVDFVGIPRVANGKDGKSYLELVRQELFQEVDSIFIDEFNRAHDKVTNAVMELIQFKSINGIRLPKLKRVWAAINPANDESYHVKPLDLAVKDRFHIQFLCDTKFPQLYFENLYGKYTTEALSNWYGTLKPEVKKNVSPRRLEYAVKVFQMGGDIKHVLPRDSGVAQLITNLKSGSPLQTFMELMDDKKANDKLKTFLERDSNYRSIKDKLMSDKAAVVRCSPLLNQEHLVEILNEQPGLLKPVLEVVDDNEHVREAILSLQTTSPNEKLKEEIKKNIQSLTPKNVAFKDKLRLHFGTTPVVTSMSSLATVDMKRKYDKMPERQEDFNKLKDSFPLMDDQRILDNAQAYDQFVELACKVLEKILTPTASNDITKEVAIVNFRDSAKIVNSLTYITSLTKGHTPAFSNFPHKLPTFVKIWTDKKQLTQLI